MINIDTIMTIIFGLSFGLLLIVFSIFIICISADHIINDIETYKNYFSKKGNKK